MAVRRYQEDIEVATTPAAFEAKLDTYSAACRYSKIFSALMCVVQHLKHDRLVKAHDTAKYTIALLEKEIVEAALPKISEKVTKNDDEL